MEITKLVKNHSERSRLMLHRDIFFQYEYNYNWQFLKGYERYAVNLLCLKRPADLCAYLKMDFQTLQKLINQPEYHHYLIAKKSGGNRQIDAPNQTLKKIQKQLNRSLQGIYLCYKPISVHGFIIHPRSEKRAANIVENALPHVRKKYVLNIDLENFFPSIKAKRIQDLFNDKIFPFNENMVNAFTLLTTINGYLPQGAPTSPVLSNMVCFKLDNQLEHWCKQNEITYTRYADDLTFSSDNPIDTKLIVEIRSIIVQNDFCVNEKKLRKRTQNKKQTVTGLVVNEKVNIDRKLMKKVRAMLHDFRLNGLKSATQKHFKLSDIASEKKCESFLNKLNGYVGFIGQVRGLEDQIYLKFKEQLAGVNQNDNHAN